MREGNSFSLLVCPQGEGGTPRYLPTRPRYLPPSQVRTWGRGYPKVPTPPPGQGTYSSPSQVRTGGRGYPKVPTPLAMSGWGRGYPKVPNPPPPQSRYLPPKPRTSYTTGGMSLAFTQEDFLVINFVFLL